VSGPLFYLSRKIAAMDNELIKGCHSFKRFKRSASSRLASEKNMYDGASGCSQESVGEGFGNHRRSDPIQTRSFVFPRSGHWRGRLFGRRGELLAVNAFLSL